MQLLAKNFLDECLAHLDTLGVYLHLNQIEGVIKIILIHLQLDSMNWKRRKYMAIKNH